MNTHCSTMFYLPGGIEKTEVATAKNDPQTLRR